jgi:hypothetical protein
MTQTVHGWNLSVLKAGIEDAILSTGYEGTPAIDFEVRCNRVVVRPDSRLSRALSNTWLKILLMITLVYPLLWLYKRIDGGRWTIAGSAYALNRRELGPNDAQPNAPSNDPRTLICLKETDWLRMWETTICRMVMDHKIEDSETLIYDLGVPQAP